MGRTVVQNVDAKTMENVILLPENVFARLVGLVLCALIDVFLVHLGRVVPSNANVLIRVRAITLPEIAYALQVSWAKNVSIRVQPIDTGTIALKHASANMMQRVTHKQGDVIVYQDGLEPNAENEFAPIISMGKAVIVPVTVMRQTVKCVILGLVNATVSPVGLLILVIDHVPTSCMANDVQPHVIVEITRNVLQ